MNYIKQLEYSNNLKSAEICGLRAAISDLEQYLSSPKFWEDTTVQVNDIFSRLREAEVRTQNLIDTTPKPK